MKVQILKIWSNRAIAGFVGKFELGPSFAITLLKNFFSRGALGVARH
jgi:hypothetical protein